MTPLKLAREYLNISQERLAALADVDQTTISIAERKEAGVSKKLAAKLVPHLQGVVTDMQLMHPDRFPFVPPKEARKVADANEAA